MPMQAEIASCILAPIGAYEGHYTTLIQYTLSYTHVCVYTEYIHVHKCTHALQLPAGAFQPL